jgi:hypothetical protein
LIINNNYYVYSNIVPYELYYVDICASAKTWTVHAHKHVLRALHKHADHYDEDMKSWRQQVSSSDRKAPDYVLVMDNIDKTISPRYMHVDHQAQSLHFTHAYATHNRYDAKQVAELLDVKLKDARDTSVCDFLPTVADTMAISRTTSYCAVEF